MAARTRRVVLEEDEESSGIVGDEAGEDTGAGTDNVEFKRSVFACVFEELRVVFKERGLSVVRGGKPHGSFLRERGRIDGRPTPLWVPLLSDNGSDPGNMINAMYVVFPHDSYGWRWVRNGFNNAVSLATAAHASTSDFVEMPRYTGDYCFANGVFNTFDMTFVSWDEYELSPQACSRVKFDVDFDPDWLAGGDTTVAEFESIIQLQGWSPEEMELLKGMMGRLAFPLGLFDKWQTCLFLTGVGGSGKTTLTDSIIHAAYADQQIGYMSTTIEKNFPFEALQHVDVVVAADIDTKLTDNLSQTDLHKMINGEEIEVNRKGLGRVTKKWTAPTLIVANVVPNWQDDQGQMARRVVYFDFSKKPAQANAGLAAALAQPMNKAKLLVHTAKCYHELCNRWMGLTMQNIISTHFPRLFKVGGDVQKENSPIQKFIDEMLVYRPGSFLAIRTLQDWKTKYCQHQDIAPTAITFSTQFKNIVSGRKMKFYDMCDVKESDAYKNAPTSKKPKGPLIDDCVINGETVLNMQA